MKHIKYINELSGEIDALRLLIISLASTHPARDDAMRQFQQRLEAENASMLARKISDSHIEGMNRLAAILQGEIAEPAQPLAAPSPPDNRD